MFRRILLAVAVAIPALAVPAAAPGASSKLTNLKRCNARPGEPSLPPGSRFYTRLKLVTWDGRYKKHVEDRSEGC